MPPLLAPPPAPNHATPLLSLFAPPQLMRTDAQDARDAHCARDSTPLLSAHDALDATPLPPLLAAPSALMHAAPLHSLLASP
eukprot:3632570-Rhodomonas_salina.1